VLQTYARCFPHSFNRLSVHKGKPDSFVLNPTESDKARSTLSLTIRSRSDHILRIYLYHYLYHYYKSLSIRFQMINIVSTYCFTGDTVQHCSTMLDIARTDRLRTDWDGEWIESHLFALSVRTNSITLRQNILLKNRCWKTKRDRNLNVIHNVNTYFINNEIIFD